MPEVMVYLGLGSNLGQRLGNLVRAVNLLKAEPALRVTAVSSVYETAPVGYTPQPWFLNCVVELRTSLTPREVLALAKAIEQKLGREKGVRWGPRVVDVDVLLYDHIEMSTEILTIPHPRMFARRFVLDPLAELAPELMAPDGTPIGALANSMTDQAVTLMAPFPGGDSDAEDNSV